MKRPADSIPAVIDDAVLGAVSLNYLNPKRQKVTDRAAATSASLGEHSVEGQRAIHDLAAVAASTGTSTTLSSLVSTSAPRSSSVVVGTQTN